MVLKRVPRSRADRGICRGGSARVRAKCCRLGYVGDGLCGRTTGYKGECAIEMSKSREQNHTSKIRFQNHRILRLRASRALRKAPLRQRKVPAAQRRGCPPPRRWMALLCLWAAHHWSQRVEIAARRTPRRATVRGGAGAAATGLPLAVGGAIIGAAPWSPQPKHHRQKQQRHQLC